jgi:predicted nucleotidyltransferase
MHALGFLKKKLTRFDVENDLQHVLQCLIKSCDPYQVYLFGSLAKNNDTFTNQSDIDIYIILNSFSEIKSAKKSFYSNFSSSTYPIDIVWSDKDRFEKMGQIGGIDFIVKDEGELLYSKAQSEV